MDSLGQDVISLATEGPNGGEDSESGRVTMSCGAATDSDLPGVSGDFACPSRRSWQEGDIQSWR